MAAHGESSRASVGNIGTECRTIGNDDGDCMVVTATRATNAVVDGQSVAGHHVEFPFGKGCHVFIEHIGINCVCLVVLVHIADLLLCAIIVTICPRWQGGEYNELQCQAYAQPHALEFRMFITERRNPVTFSLHK